MFSKGPPSVAARVERNWMSALWPQGQETLPLDALEFAVRHDPALVLPTTALAFFSVDATEAAPFADGKFRFTKDLCQVVRPVPVPHGALAEQDVECRLHAVQAPNQCVQAIGPDRVRATPFLRRREGGLTGGRRRFSGVSRRLGVDEG